MNRLGGQKWGLVEGGCDTGPGENSGWAQGWESQGVSAGNPVGT